MSSATSSKKKKRVVCVSVLQSIRAKIMSDLVPSNSRYWLGIFSSVIFFSFHRLLVSSTYSFTVSRRVCRKCFSGEGVGEGVT